MHSLVISRLILSDKVLTPLIHTSPRNSIHNHFERTIIPLCRNIPLRTEAVHLNR